jgi:hypothetical protein
MTKEQMEIAATEACDLLARHDAGTLEPDLELEERSGFRVLLEHLLREREAWLRGGVIKAGVAQDVDSQTPHPMIFERRYLQWPRLNDERCG